MPATTQIGGNGSDELHGAIDTSWLIWPFQRAAGGKPLNNYLDGRGGDDAIYAGEGNDTLFGGGGKDWLQGDGGNDLIREDSRAVAGRYAYYGNDVAWGGEGNDTIEFQYTLDAVRLGGGAGHDQIQGGGGRDTITGDAGNDWIHGGPGGDDLFGGSEGDVFVFSGLGQSGRDFLDTDWIGDFSPSEDRILGDVPGTAANYSERDIAYNSGYEAARNYGDVVIGLSAQHGRPIHYHFVSDGVNGYLFADFDRDGRADSGVIIAGLTSKDQFSEVNII